MKLNAKHNTKHHIWFYEFERLWLSLSLINIIAVFLIIRGSTAPLIWDSKILYSLFYSPETSDKTLYNIAISYFAAYIFYIIQIYHSDKKKTQRALTTMELPARNLITQTNMFLFVWENFAKRNSPDNGVIVGVNISKIYYKGNSGHVMSADKSELGDIVGRIRSDYLEIVDSNAFQYCDNALRQLLLEKNIPDEMNKLYQTLLSAELLAQDPSTTILESYSNEDVDDIRARLKKLNDLLGLECDFDYAITTDENDIRKRQEIEVMGLKIVSENFNYFSKLPDSYRETLK